MDTRRPKSKREAKDNLEKDSGKGKKQGRVGKLGGSQSSGTEQAVLDRKRDGLMRLLARRELMMMMIVSLHLSGNFICTIFARPKPVGTKTGHKKEGGTKLLINATMVENTIDFS